MESFTSPILSFVASCPGDADPTTNSLSWEARFREGYPEIYPAVKEIAKPFVGKDAIAIMPSQYREPTFWKDLCADLNNIRGLPDEGKLLQAVEKLLNGEGPEREEVAKELVGSFWTLLVVLMNLDSINQHLLILVLKYGPSLLDFVDDEVFRGVVAMFEEDTFDLACLSEESFLYMLNSKRVDISPGKKERMLLLSCHEGYAIVLPLLLPIHKLFDSRYTSCLSVAARMGNSEVVRILLKCESVDPADGGSEALRYAAEDAESTEVVQLLLEDGRADPTLFMSSWVTWTLEIVSLLLKDGRIDPLHNESYAFRHAALSSNVELVKMLLGDGRADPCTHQDRSLRSASYRGGADIVRLISEDGRADGRALNTALVIASQMGYVDIVRTLLENSQVDPTANNNRAVWAASENMDLEIVDVLLADPRVQKKPAEDEILLMACQEGLEELAMLLMKGGRADPTAYENHAIKVMSKTGNPQMVRLLLCDRRVTQATIQQAIAWALEFGNNDVARSLLDDPLVPICSDDKELL